MRPHGAESGFDPYVELFCHEYDGIFLISKIVYRCLGIRDTRISPATTFMNTSMVKRIQFYLPFLFAMSITMFVHKSYIIIIREGPVLMIILGCTDYSICVVDGSSRESTLSRSRGRRKGKDLLSLPGGSPRSPRKTRRKTTPTNPGKRRKRRETNPTNPTNRSQRRKNRKGKQ